MYDKKEIEKLLPRLFLFPFHRYRLLRAFVSTDPAALAEIEINHKVLADCRIGAKHGTDTACIAFHLVNNGFEYPPGSGLS